MPGFAGQRSHLLSRRWHLQDAFRKAAKNTARLDSSSLPAAFLKTPSCLEG